MVYIIIKSFKNLIGISVTVNIDNTDNNNSCYLNINSCNNDYISIKCDIRSNCYIEKN